MFKAARFFLAFLFNGISVIIKQNSQMRWLSRLLFIPVVCIIATALPSAPAQAICVPWGVELSPKSGFPGTNVTISGHDFYEDKLVDIYYDGDLIATGRTDSGGDFALTFTVPEDCSGPYQVLADVGYVEVGTYFTVKPGLIISPGKGPEGTNVMVKGRGFARNEEEIELMYYLNDNYETIERHIVADTKGSWEITFRIPSSTSGEHKIDAQGAVSHIYEVIDTTFRVTAQISMDKSSGIAGDTITMTGSRFAAYEKDIRILFDGQPVATDIKANSKGEWEASFQVPDMPAGEYSVTAEGAQTKKEDLIELSFQIGAHIILSAYEGHVGTEVIVTGHGFAANEGVDIMYDSNQVATTQTDAKGDFEASFTVPESQHGERTVTAGYDGENHANAIFTMESNLPPTPSLISPSKGSRMGFMGTVTPTFEWLAVFDDSGVSYSLQIATSPNVAATGGFAAPIVSVSGLVETSYTLNETQALPNGAYYWIVQAVDSAENESGWTTARSFRVGLLPMWGLILAIVAAVVLLAFLIRALVARRNIYYDRW
jgi:hypothetical protein